MEKPAENPNLTQAGEPLADAGLAPEAHNAEQDDEDGQAQTLADESLGRSSTFAGSETERVGTEDETTSAPDLVDHMHHMVTSGRIDMSAYRGERSDDDEDGMLGEQGREDEFPRGSE